MNADATCPRCGTAVRRVSTPEGPRLLDTTLTYSGEWALLKYRPIAVAQRADDARRSVMTCYNEHRC